MGTKQPNGQDKVEHLTRQFMRHQQLLLAYISTIILDRHRAEDVLQETAVVLFRRLDEYGGVQNLWPLAREIARRQAIAFLQKESKSPRILSDAQIQAIDKGFDQVHQANWWEESQLHECLTKLPNLWQKIVRMRYWTQCSVQQISKNLGTSENTISVTLNRARGRLADCLRHSFKQEKIV